MYIQLIICFLLIQNFSLVIHGYGILCCNLFDIKVLKYIFCQTTFYKQTHQIDDLRIGWYSTGDLQSSFTNTTWQYYF